ncbi:molybdopterin-dependent oxidoreductase [Pseudalkalibacillus caeni]|uniref:Molybdopterin oxidoreductase family protein n=1 Tax=Exobacillus caeni TaxID=2574798 RepID=A0A5R9FFV8_9BACL|nr:molybdopterin-dependent oxidoreductase [Pseudalkalibacillus caeni]TLS38445.1 molybdopterin oxidoreductase family protein [Pseudalkalibacillus caeni]
MHNYQNESDGIFPSVCSLDCPDQCGLLVHKQEGKIIKVEGDPNHPVTKGAICNKVRNMTHRIYESRRLKYPLKRVGPKGEGKFKRISWEEAIKTITTRWEDLIATSGPESILPYSFYGNMGRINSEGMDRRFFNRLGASRLERTICSSAGSEGIRYTMGGGFGTDPEDTIHSKLIIFWGINAVSTNMHQVALAQKARKENGAKIVVIDVHKNQTGRLADWFIPIKPGTDAALALAIMNILFQENLIDQEFLNQYTVGYKDLRKHVEQYDPVSVAAITGVPAEDIYQLARMYGTTSPSFIRIGNGIQHHDNGGMCIRTISCLPALTGQWQVRGGGAIKGNSGYLSFNKAALQRPDLLKGTPRSVNMNLLGRALLGEEPPINSLYVYNSNPAIVAPDSNKVREGLAREDLFTVVHDLFLTETAAYADIVLPATSSFENKDFYTSYWHHYVQIQVPVIENYYESKSNTEVFRLLATGLGFDDAAFQDTEEEMINQALDFQSNVCLTDITYESLKDNQYMKANRRTVLDHLTTPSGKIELYSEQMKKDGYPPLPTYIPCKDDEEFPFLFVPGPNHNFLNSTFSHQEKHQKLEKDFRLYMNEEDALEKGIKDGDKVRIWNNLGDCELTVSVGEKVLPGVLVTQGLWADDTSDKKWLINTLTPDRIADMGGGATFFSGKIDVTKI